MSGEWGLILNGDSDKWVQIEITNKSINKFVLLLSFMNSNFLVATILLSLTIITTSALSSVSFSTTNDDPRSDKACDKMVDLEGFQDSRTEFDSTIPDSDKGSQKAF